MSHADDLALFEKLADTLESQNEHEQAMAAVGRVRERLDTLERERDDGLTTTRMPDSAAARMSYLEMEVERLRDGLRRIAEGDWPDDFVSFHSNPFLLMQDYARALLAVPSAHKPAKDGEP